MPAEQFGAQPFSFVAAKLGARRRPPLIGIGAHRLELIPHYGESSQRHLGVEKRRGRVVLLTESERQYFRSHVMRTANGCLEWIGRRDADGYGLMKVAGKERRASHVALALRGISVPKGQLACHNCDNPPCCDGEHLFVGTHVQNTQDAIIKGRRRRHIAAGQRVRWPKRLRKLSPEVIAAIRSSTDSCRELGRRHGISHTHAWQIRHGERCSLF